MKLTQENVKKYWASLNFYDKDIKEIGGLYIRINDSVEKQMR